VFVVLDTNIFYRDFLLRGNAFRILLESTQYVPARPCIPEVVLDETLAKYREALSERVEAHAKAQSRLRRILLKSPDAEPFVLDEHEVLHAYEAHLKARLVEAGAKFLPYPTDPHKEVVKRALLRGKPFDVQGRGYRDYLIWASLRSEMYYAPEETVVLVTANTRDFCDGDTLAESLQDDLARYHHPGIRVSVVASLEAFNNVYVLPKLERREELRAALQDGGESALDLHSWAAKRLPGLLRDEEYLVVATHGLEPEHATVYASAIDSIDDLSVIDVRALSPSRQLVIASARVNAVLSVEVDGDQYSRYRESRELLGDYLEPYASASWYERAELVVRFSLVLNEEGTDVIAAEIDAVEGQGGKLETDVSPR
jgi:predicted nucleic acid-binding protein